VGIDVDFIGKLAMFFYQPLGDLNALANLKFYLGNELWNNILITETHLLRKNSGCQCSGVFVLLAVYWLYIRNTNTCI